MPIENEDIAKEIYDSIPDGEYISRKSIMEKTGHTGSVVSYYLTKLAKLNLITGGARAGWRRVPGAVYTPYKRKLSPRASSSTVNSANKIMVRLEEIATSLLELIEQIKPLMISPHERQEFDELRAYRAKIEEQLANMVLPKFRRK